jgi:hypothetical protein
MSTGEWHIGSRLEATVQPPRPRMPALRLWAIALIACTGCATTAFNKTGAALGKSMNELPRAIASEGDLAGRLCEQRSRLDFLHHRVEGSRAFAWDTSPRWTEWWSTHLRDKARPELGTWADHCARIERVSQAQAQSARLLAAYGHALSVLVDDGKYEGEDLKRVAESAGSISETLGGDSFLARSKSAIANAADPMKQLANLLLANYTRSQLANTITRAAPAVDSILEGLESYCETVETERTDALDRLETVLNAAEPSLAGTDRPADGAHAFVFHDFAVRWTDDLRAPALRQKTYVAALKDLREAHRRLGAEARRRKPDRRGLNEICSRAAAVGEALVRLGSPHI